LFDLFNLCREFIIKFAACIYEVQDCVHTGDRARSNIRSLKVIIGDILLSGHVQKLPKDDQRVSEDIFGQFYSLYISYFDVLFLSYGYTMILFLT
jgi:hypothetical protein